MTAYHYTCGHATTTPRRYSTSTAHWCAECRALTKIERITKNCADCGCALILGPKQGKVQRCPGCQRQRNLEAVATWWRVNNETLRRGDHGHRIEK